MVGKMKANLSRHLRLRYPALKQTYWGAVLLVSWVVLVDGWVE
jgi:hypothetical protein